MNKLWTISYESMFRNMPEEKVFFALVSGEENEIQKLCEKLGEYKDSSMHDYYSYKPARIKVLGEGEDYFKVFTTKTNGGLYLEQPEKLHIIKDSKQNFVKRIENQNAKRADEMIGYEQIKVLNVQQAWELYVNNMKNINITIYEEENIL